MRSCQITQWCQRVMEMEAAKGGRYIDATMGNGNDTLFLCGLAGEGGSVTAFDVQELALERTKKLLSEHGMAHRARLLLDSHVNMDRYEEPASVDVICFNFGYLPGGAHGMSTRAETSVQAIRKGLSLLKPGALMSLCIYSGGDTGFLERAEILALLKSLDARQYTVMLHEYYNRPNNPPLPAFIFKAS